MARCGVAIKCDGLQVAKKASLDAVCSAFHICIILGSSRAVIYRVIADAKSFCACCELFGYIGAQAGAHVAGNLDAVRGLMQHPAFAMSNPNMCYSLFLSFLRSTPNFHAADGSGYAFLADSILQARVPFSATSSCEHLAALQCILSHCSSCI